MLNFKGVEHHMFDEVAFMKLSCFLPLRLSVGSGRSLSLS